MTKIYFVTIALSFLAGYLFRMWYPNFNRERIAVFLIIAAVILINEKSQFFEDMLKKILRGAMN